MQRIVAVPDTVPENFVPIIMVFSELDADQNTQLSCHATETILRSLRLLPEEKRLRVVRTICANIQLMLVQNSGSVKTAD